MNCFVLAAIKKFGGAPAPVHGAVHRRRGDRLAVLAPGDRAARARARGSASTPSPAAARGAAVTGRKGGVFMRFEITGKAAHSGANFEMGISAINELAHKTLALHALSDPPKRHHAQRRRRVRRPDRQHRGALGQGRGRSALHHAGRSATRPWPRSRRSWPRAMCRARAPSSRSPASSCRWSRPPTARRCTSTTRRALKELGVAETDGAVHRRLRRFRLCLGDRHADDLRGRPGRRPRAFAGRVSGDRHAGAARPGAGAGGAAAALAACRRLARSMIPAASCRHPRKLMSSLFSPIKLADLELANRIVVSPMCQYSADDGTRQRLASRPSRHAGELRRGPRDRRGDACRARRPHHPRLHRALFRRQRGGAGARHRALPAHRHRQARHPVRACRPQGLGAAAVGGRRRAASRRRSVADHRAVGDRRSATNWHTPREATAGRHRARARSLRQFGQARGAHRLRR